MILLGGGDEVFHLDLGLDEGLFEAHALGVAEVALVCGLEELVRMRAHVFSVAVEQLAVHLDEVVVGLGVHSGLIIIY